MTNAGRRTPTKRCSDALAQSAVEPGAPWAAQAGKPSPPSAPALSGGLA